MLHYQMGMQTPGGGHFDRSPDSWAWMSDATWGALGYSGALCVLTIPPTAVQGLLHAVGSSSRRKHV